MTSHGCGAPVLSGRWPTRHLRTPPGGPHRVHRSRTGVPLRVVRSGLVRLHGWAQKAVGSGSIAPQASRAVRTRITAMPRLAASPQPASTAPSGPFGASCGWSARSLRGLGCRGAGGKTSRGRGGRTLRGSGCRGWGGRTCWGSGCRGAGGKTRRGSGRRGGAAEAALGGQTPSRAETPEGALAATRGKGRRLEPPTSAPRGRGNAALEKADLEKPALEKAALDTARATANWRRAARRRGRSASTSKSTGFVMSMTKSLT